MQKAIQFYLPWQQDGIDTVPTQVEDYWSWIVPRRNIGEGKYSWTLQTYLQLRRAGVPCVLTPTFPESGIVISHRDFLPIFLLPRANAFLVCIKPDRKEHTWAQHYLVQNERDAVFSRLSSARATQVKFWPQPSLLPRDVRRGARCETVAYFGRSMNLSPELLTPEWSRELEAIGFRWLTPPIDRWNDYREIDITVSVRSFGTPSHGDNAILDPNSKPPAKLTNSWLAGVPAIVAEEPSYLSIRRSPLDFIGVASKEDLKRALIALRENPSLYKSMQSHGLKRALEFSSDSVVACWQEAIASHIIPAEAAWMRRSRYSRHALNIRSLARYFSRKRNIVDLFNTAIQPLKSHLPGRAKG